MSEFDEYIVHGEPGKREKAHAWQTGNGLQYVDGVKVSTYLLDTARQHIEGDITIDV
ncbi:MAG: antitoxin VbhA family protein [Bacteroides sp.]|nr:antitoxin VbhA family protein [Bacteroides sp.]